MYFSIETYDGEGARFRGFFASLVEAKKNLRRVQYHHGTKVSIAVFKLDEMPNLNFEGDIVERINPSFLTEEETEKQQGKIARQDQKSRERALHVLQTSKDKEKRDNATRVLNNLK